MPLVDEIAQAIRDVGNARAAGVARNGAAWGGALMDMGALASKTAQEMQQAKIQQQEAALRNQQMAASQQQIAASKADVSLAQNRDTREGQAFTAQQTANAQAQVAALHARTVQRLGAVRGQPQLWNATRAGIIADGLAKPEEIPTSYPGDDAIDAELRGLMSAKDQFDIAHQKIEVVPANSTGVVPDSSAPNGFRTVVTPGIDPKEVETARHNKAMEDIGRTTAGRESAAQAETARHNREMENLQNPFGSLGVTAGASPQSANAGPAPATQGPTGDAYLKQLDPSIAAQVKAYAEGRQPFPTGMSAYRLMPLIKMVTQYDPTFDAANYNARNKARTDLTSPSGTGGKTINSLNTAIQHAGVLSDLVEAEGNSNIPAANYIANAWSKATGGTKVTNFEAVQPQLMKEIERLWRGAGGSEGDIQALKDSLGPNAGIQQQREALNNFMTLMQGKLDSTQQQRDNVLGPVAGAQIPVLFDQNKPIVAKIHQRASPSGSSAPAASATPKDGTEGVINGRAVIWTTIPGKGSGWVPK